MAARKFQSKHNFINLSFRDAKTMASRNFSCINGVPHEMEVSMSSKFITCIAHGLKERLDKELFYYNKKLKGVPLAYNKIQVNKRTIIDDQEKFALSIKVTFLVFFPKIGDVLLGVVNKIDDYHMGCLIHKCINGSIRHPNTENLTQMQINTVENIEIGSEVIFSISQIENHYDVLLVIGDIAPQFYQRKRRESQCSVKEDHFNGFESSNENKDTTTKNKKKKRKAEENDRLDNLTIKEETVEENLLKVVDAPHKKKKKRRTSESTDTITNNQEKVKKKKKKREREVNN